jgi:maltose O-acetyltransferase
MILDASFHKIVDSSSVTAEVVIEDDVWVAANVIILPGVRIRRGSVVVAGSVVTKSFDEEAVLLAGNPAKIVK